MRAFLGSIAKGDGDWHRVFLGAFFRLHVGIEGDGFAVVGWSPWRGGVLMIGTRGRAAEYSKELVSTMWNNVTKILLC